MPPLDVVVSCPVTRSFRVEQVAGMFDVPLSEKTSQRFQAEMPDESEDWQIGLIVGPSGSGKSTVARHKFGDKLYQIGTWPNDKAVVDGFGNLPIKTITGLLTAVGFSSPPSWVKPFAVLSNGEQFRCDMARALSLGCEQPQAVVVMDEFTSVVDRNVAKIGSAAISKGIRSGHIPTRFVAVTCHYDVAEWLEPDWILDMATGELDRRRLRRPPIELEIHETNIQTWSLFRKHHYLSSDIPSGKYYIATWHGEPVAFCSTTCMTGYAHIHRIARIVTLPDYQGVGIGMKVCEAVAHITTDTGVNCRIIASHPAVITHCKNSRKWCAKNVSKNGYAQHRGGKKVGVKTSSGRAVVSFEYVGAKG